MKKTIKMVVLVDGQEIIVGQCHPGQARILRKNGMAEWVKDKLILKQAIEYRSWIQALREDGVDEADVRHVLARDAGWGAYQPETFVKEARFFNGVSPEQWEEIDADGELRRGLKLLSRTEERDSENLSEWVKELRDRKEQGHTVYCCDDHRSLKLGFVDHDDGVWFKLSLRRVKMATDEEYSDLGLDRKSFSSSEGREELIGGWDFLKMPEVESVEVPEGITLESLLIEEALEENAKLAELSRGQEFCFVKGMLAVREDLPNMTDEEVEALLALTRPEIEPGD